MCFVLQLFFVLWQMFVVRYDSDYRAFLANHTDDADISINILLTNDFEGGGTQFWNRQLEKPFARVQPNKVGQMLTHSALINHEGMPTTKGTRIIFVGFLSVDRIDPFSADANPESRLNVFSSWLSLPWVNVKFKEAYNSAKYRRRHELEKWSNNKYAVSLFLDMTNILKIIGDYFLPHHVENLVAPEDTERHLKALDDAYESREQSDPNNHANWFAGQQIDLDIDGTITNEWSTRVHSRNRFMEL
jgi:hypothetical protein